MMIMHSRKLTRTFVGTLVCGVALASAALPAAAVSDSVSEFAVAKAAGPGARGWQGNFTYNAPAGSGGIFFHYPCPAGAPVAVNGGYSVNETGATAFKLIGSYSRSELAYNEWAWNIKWTGGAPAGTQIVFNVYCLKTNPIK